MPAIERICKITGEKFQVSKLEQALRKKFGVVTSMPPEDKLLCDECYREKVI